MQRYNLLSLFRYVKHLLSCHFDQPFTCGCSFLTLHDVLAFILQYFVVELEELNSLDIKLADLVGV
jgi:hypothetical protein